MRTLVLSIHWVFTVYTLMIGVRIIGSWFPAFSQNRMMGFLRVYTDPYLNLFRRFIRPIGGVFDLTPLLAFFGLQMLEKCLLFILI